ncbi:MAG: DUF2130 domain-containing protein [Ignavibacteriae bacterium]|nr:DUF2130 domain-containing protein [Ignavibacteriota bacterium]
MVNLLKCPVCGKPLTEVEYDKALGLWKDKQEHIKHLEAEQKKLKEQERLNRKKLEAERRRIREQEKAYKQQAKEQAKEFKRQQAKLLRDSKRILTEQAKKSTQQLKDQRTQLQKSFNQKLKSEIKKGVEQGVEEQKREFKKQQADLKKTKNKMSQLENSLKVSAKKYEQANEEIKKLKDQIEKGITPQIEGLLEESKLLAKLKELFPNDRFEHPGKGGDIIQVVMDHSKEVGKIVYECKKVKSFNKNHVEQAKEARRLRQADFAVLVTNAFPSKKQYYFVEKTVFVISPVSLEPITYTLRESLVRMAILKMTNEAKQKAVQRVYDYLSSAEYNNKMNDVANQLIDLAKDLKLEIKSHKDRWGKRYTIYSRLYSDVGLIDFKLKGLVQNKLDEKVKLLPPPKKDFVEIEELGH